MRFPTRGSSSPCSPAAPPPRRPPRRNRRPSSATCACSTGPPSAALGNVLIRGTRIAEIGPRLDAPADATVVDETDGRFSRAS